MDEEIQGGEEQELTAEEKIALLEEKLAKLEDKTQNMANLRKKANKAEGEKDTLEERLGFVEEQMKAERDAKTSIIDSAKERLLQQYAGDDDAEREKLNYEYNLLNMPENTPEQVEAKFRKASLLVENSSSTSPLSASIPSSSEPLKTAAKKGTFLDTDDGKQMAKDLGMGDLLEAQK